MQDLLSPSKHFWSKVAREAQRAVQSRYHYSLYAWRQQQENHVDLEGGELFYFAIYAEDCIFCEDE